MANVKSIFLGKNTSYGDVPSTTAADYLEIPIASFSGGKQSQRIPSRNIRNSRQPQAAILASTRVSGSVSMEFSAQTYDEVLQAALLSAAWAKVDGSANLKASSLTLAVDASAKTVDASTGTPFAGLAAGDWVRLEKTGWTNNGIALRVTGLRSSGLGFSYDAFSRTVTTDASETGCVVRWGEELVIGTTERIFTLVERVAQIGADLFVPYLRARFDGFGLNIVPGQAMQMQAPWIAGEAPSDFDGTITVDSTTGEYDTAGATTVQLSTYIGSGYTAAPGNDSFTPVSESSALMVNAAPGANFTSLQFALTNNTQGTQVLFHQGDKYLAAGEAGISGSFRAVFENETYHDLLETDADVAIACYIVDSDGLAYVIDFPSCKLGGGETPIANASDLVESNFSFTGGLNSTTNQSMRVQRFTNA